MKRILAIVMMVCALAGFAQADGPMTWGEYADLVEQDARSTTQEIKAMYDRDGTLSDKDLEALYRIYKLQRAAREIKLSANMDFGTLVVDGVDVYADTDEVLADSWKEYITGEIDKATFLGLFWILYR